MRSQKPVNVIDFCLWVVLFILLSCTVTVSTKKKKKKCSTVTVERWIAPNWHLNLGSLIFQREASCKN